MWTKEVLPFSEFSVSVEVAECMVNVPVPGLVGHLLSVIQN